MEPISARAVSAPDPGQGLFEACPEGIALLDAEGRILRSNAAAAALGLGVRNAEFFALLHVDDRKPARRALLESRPGDVFDLSFRLWPGEGREYHLAAKVRNALGDSTGGYVLSLREIPLVLGESPVTFPLPQEVGDPRALMLAAIVDTLPIMACRIDAHGIIRESFGGGLARIGLRDGEAVGMNVFELWPNLKADFRKAYSGEAVQFEFETIRAERRVLDVRFIPDAANPGDILGFAMDVTDRKRAEEALHKSETQLRQAQKMEAMGRLAGGVAHDFNNLLTAINGYGELLAHAMGEDDPLRGNVEEIRRAGERAATLTRQLLTFSRKQVLTRRVLDMNRVVTEVRQMLVRLIGEDVELATATDPELDRVSIDPGQLEQVILNLALNARDAMPMGGRLSIETANVRLDPRQSGVFFPVDVGSYVRLTVTDTGFGMSEEVKAHLFEPFFSTKPQGQGTGLGLCSVYGIVKQAGGNISVWSEPGRGTSVSVFLPALEPERAQDVRSKEPETSCTVSGNETILLAEDEEVVRKLVSQLLSTQGYRVLAAESGPEALEMASHHPGPIDLLLTDVVMVGMSGRELAEKLMNARPKTKVLYMSGYTDDAILRHGVYQSSAAFLSKPFSTVALIRKIRDVLQMQESGKHAAGSAVS